MQLSAEKAPTNERKLIHDLNLSSLVTIYCGKKAAAGHDPTITRNCSCCTLRTACCTHDNVKFALSTTITSTWWQWCTIDYSHITTVDAIQSKVDKLNSERDQTVLGTNRKQLSDKNNHIILLQYNKRYRSILGPTLNST